LTIKNHSISIFPNAPKNSSTNGIHSRMILVSRPTSSYGFIGGSNLNLQKHGNWCPDFSGHNAIKEKVCDWFRFTTEFTLSRFAHVPFSRLSLVISLLLDNNQRKMWILGGTVKDQIEGI
jgi:hypothetical protein